MKKGISLLLAALLASAAGAHAAPPAWWSTPFGANNTVAVNANAADDFAVANIGQLKNMAASARAMLNATYPNSGGAGTAIDSLVNGWLAGGGDNYAGLNQGQLKAVAKLFYDRLAALGWHGAPLTGTNVYPWTTTTGDDDSFALVNIGQLKTVFSFAPSAVTVLSEWAFTDEGFIAGGQNGAGRSYGSPSAVAASPWSFVTPDHLGLRLDWENSSNCPNGINGNTQSATAVAVVRAERDLVLTINWSGMGELQDSGFELMELYIGECNSTGTLLDGENLVGAAHAPGGGQGCGSAETGYVGPVVSDPPPPQTITLEAGKYYRLNISATTADPLYHTGAWYQFTLGISDPVTP